MSEKLPRPTETELEILRVLWTRGPSTVRQVYNVFSRERETDVSYSTALKMLQVMTQKGLVERDESERPQIYRTTLAQEKTQRQLLDDLLERAFGGSKRQLVMHALANEESSDEDLARIERLLDEFEEKEK